MLKPLVTALVGALIVASPATAREDVVQVDVRTHNGKGGVVEGCELTFVYMVGEDAEGFPLTAHSGSLSVLGTSNGGRIVGLKLTVLDDRRLQAPERAWVFDGERNNRDEFSRLLDTDENFSLFAFAYGPASAALLQGYQGSGRVDVGYRLPGGEAGTFSIEAGKGTSQADWTTCMAALPA